MKIVATASLVKVTPEMATEWLSERWGEQRSIRQQHVGRLVADMDAGRFHISPDAILLIKGKLANGQHRLQAVVVSGKPQTFLVMESNDDELYKVIDAGLKRAVYDSLFGVPYVKQIPSIARWVQSYENCNVRPNSRCPAEASVEPGCTNWPTQCQMIEYCKSNLEAFSEAAAFVNPLYEETRLLPCSIGGAIYAIAAQQNGILEKTKDFLRAVYIDGGNNAAGDLRNRLIANRGSKARLNNGYLFGITLKALKSFINGTRPGLLRWNKGEDIPSL